MFFRQNQGKIVMALIMIFVFFLTALLVLFLAQGSEEKQASFFSLHPHEEFIGIHPESENILTMAWCAISRVAGDRQRQQRRIHVLLRWFMLLMKTMRPVTRITTTLLDERRLKLRAGVPLTAALPKNMKSSTTARTVAYTVTSSMSTPGAASSWQIPTMLMPVAQLPRHVTMTSRAATRPMPSEMRVPGLPTVSTSRSSGQRIIRMLRRLHNNLACPSKEDFVRNLKVGGATLEVLKAAKSMRCTSWHGLPMVLKHNRRERHATDFHNREQDWGDNAPTVPVVRGPNDSQRRAEETARQIAINAEYMRICGMEEELRMQQEQFRQQTVMAQERIAFMHAQITEQYHTNQHAHVEVVHQKQVTDRAALGAQQQAASVAAAQANIVPVALDFGALSPHNRDLWHRSIEAGTQTAPDDPEL